MEVEFFMLGPHTLTRRKDLPNQIADMNSTAYFDPQTKLPHWWVVDVAECGGEQLYSQNLCEGPSDFEWWLAGPDRTSVLAVAGCYDIVCRL